jgi:RNA polymerase sigma-70 factor (family 1)
MEAKEFETIYWEHCGSILIYATKILKNKDEAKDICSDVFIKFWTHRDIIKSLKSIRAYLIICTRNLCLDYIKATKNRYTIRKQVYFEQYENIQFSEADEIQAELATLMYKKINELTSRSKDVLLLTAYGLKSNDIANLLKISPKTIKNQKSLAIKDLVNKINPFKNEKS